MRKKIFKTNKEYLDFFAKYKEQIKIYQLNFTKTMQIRLFYDIM
jgi:hypothetical protein